MWFPVCRQRNINCVEQPECEECNVHTPASETSEGKFYCIVRESLSAPVHTASLEIRSVETAEDSLSDRFILSCCYFPQFNDHDFGGLSGGRIVRIATHPDFQGVSWMGFLERTFSRLIYPLFLWKACWNTLHCITTSVTTERCDVTVLNLVPRLIRLFQMRRGRPRDRLRPFLLAKCANHHECYCINLFVNAFLNIHMTMSRS